MLELFAQQGQAVSGILELRLADAVGGHRCLRARDVPAQSVACRVVGTGRSGQGRTKHGRPDPEGLGTD